MAVRTIKSGIYSVGAIDWDRTLFDELIPLPDGTSYNAFLVRGSEKTALVDTVDPTMETQLFHHLQELAVQNIDYIVVNHAEQDHSGTIPAVLERFPDSQIITNPKCQQFLCDLLHVPEQKIRTVEDGETLTLGDKTLRFIYTPWVHWPETLSTYIEEDRILFPCDLFGSHLAQADLFVRDTARTLEAAKRYYAEIMMPFRSQVKKNLTKLADLDIDIIAPSHGAVYNDPELIIDAYRDWISDDVADKVLLLFVSMHGSTRHMVDHLMEKFLKNGQEVRLFNLISADTGEIAKELVDAATVILATPQVLTGPHPAAYSAAYLVSILRPKIKFIGIMGSFGWGGKMVEMLGQLFTGMKAEMLEPVTVRGLAKDEDLARIEMLAETIREKHMIFKKKINKENKNE